MTAEETRNEAKQLLAAAARGQDPAEDRRRALRAPTVAQLAALYVKRHAQPGKKTAIADESMLRRYIVPAFGARKVEAITRSDVARLHHDLRRPLGRALTRRRPVGRSGRPCRS